MGWRIRVGVLEIGGFASPCGVLEDSITRGVLFWRICFAHFQVARTSTSGLSVRAPYFLTAASGWLRSPRVLYSTNSL